MSNATDRPAQVLHLRGVVLPEGVTRDLFIVDGRFTFTPPDERVMTIATGGYLLPGLVDAHAHLELASPAPADAPAAERSRASARAQLAAGVLAIREPGGAAHASLGIGPREGLPRTVTAGRLLAPPERFFPGFGNRETPEAELPAAAEQEARASGAWAKVIGDWPGPDGRVRPNYQADTLAEAVRRVHVAGARLAIHATCTATIEGAIEAGVDSIEHGVGLRDEHLAAMAARGIALVPTLTILPGIPALVEAWGLIPSEREATLASVAGHAEMARRAVEAGVLVLAGTDAGMGPHGMVGGEIRHLIQAGVAQETALAAGSWTARRFLGLPGIEEGAPADLVLYPDDPRCDIDALSRPSLRMLDGALVE